MTATSSFSCKHISFGVTSHIWRLVKAKDKLIMSYRARSFFVVGPLESCCQLHVCSFHPSPPALFLHSLMRARRSRRPPGGVSCAASHHSPPVAAIFNKAYALHSVLGGLRVALPESSRAVLPYQTACVSCVLNYDDDGCQLTFD